MKTEVNINNLRGNLAAIRNYANTIASMSADASNAYVMVFDKDNEILWTVQAGDDLDEVKATINWQGVRRVEIYDHSADGKYKIEYVYISSQKSLNAYTSERSAADFVVTSNCTACTADAWQTVEGDEPAQQYSSDAQGDGNSEDTHRPGMPAAGHRQPRDASSRAPAAPGCQQQGTGSPGMPAAGHRQHPIYNKV